MLPLLQRCIEEDRSESWCDFWLLLESAALRPLRRLLRRFAIDPSESEDRIQDIFVILQKDDMKKLRSFRGKTEAQLAAWLKELAVNHTLNWLRDYCRDRKRERAALAEVQRHRADRSKEIELFELVDDLKTKLTQREIDRLEILVGVTTPPQPIAETTLRRWRRQLRGKRRNS